MLKKLGYILTKNQKYRALILAGLLIVGMLMEMLGLGMMIPTLALMLKTDIWKEYPSLTPYLDALGNPTQGQLVIGVMSILMVFFFIKTCFFMFLAWKQSSFAADLFSEISNRLFLGYLRMPYTFHLQRNSAELLNNIQSEVAVFNSVSQAGIVMVSEFSVGIGISVMLFLVEPLGALIVSLFLGISALTFHRLTKRRLLNWGIRRQMHAESMSRHLLQGLGGVKDVKLLGRENYFLNEFSGHNSAYARVYTRVLTLQQVPRLYLEFLGVLGLGGLVIVMVAQDKPLERLLPVLAVFVAAAFRMMPSINRIMGASQTIRYAQPVVDVLHREFNIIKDQEELNGSPVEQNFSMEIKLSNIHFQYDTANSQALSKVSIVIPKNITVGFIGQSGSGKSTLVDIILGLLTPTKGEVIVDGKDIQKDLRAWQNQIGYVPQSIYLTDDTLRQNVAFGIPKDQIDENAVQRSIKAAQLEEFVLSLSDGMETFVGERGVRLSGGQRQRIGIARALYHDPALLVLDEATSALDTATEIGVMEAIAALQGSKTIIIVAHRLSTVRNCDSIYRFDKGEMIEAGAPDVML